MKRTPAFVVVWIVNLAVALAALKLGQESLERLAAWPAAPAGVVLDGQSTGFRPAGTSGSTPEVAAGGGPRLVIILVDGLTAGDGLRLPSVERLARQGAFYAARVPEPAWPVASWATALSGRAPAGHGLWLPTDSRNLPLPNLLALAQSRGISVALAGSEPFLRLGDLWAEQGRFAIPSGWEGTGEPLLTAARSALQSGAGLVVLHLEGLHTIAHRLLGEPPEPIPDPQGGPPRLPDPVPWDTALAWTDVRLHQILDGVDLGRTDVIIAGTYGATAAGRHGSGRAVPLVLAGPHIRAGVRGEARLQDLAPTAAALLGLPQALAPEGQVLAAVAGAEAGAGSPETGAGWSPDLPTRDLGTLWQEYRSRLPWLGGLVLILAGYGIALARQPFGPQAWSAALTCLVLTELVFWALGGQYSPEAPGLEQMGWAFWRYRALEAGVGMGLAALALGWRLARRGVPVPRRQEPSGPHRPEVRSARPRYAAVAALHAALLTSLLLAVPVLGILLYTGWEVPRFPGIPWTVKFFLDIGRMAALGLGAPVWAAAAALATATARALYPPEEADEPAPRRSGTTGAPGRLRGPVVPLAERRPRAPRR